MLVIRCGQPAYVAFGSVNSKTSRVRRLCGSMHRGGRRPLSRRIDGSAYPSRRADCRSSGEAALRSTGNTSRATGRPALRNGTQTNVVGTERSFRSRDHVPFTHCHWRIKSDKIRTPGGKTRKITGQSRTKHRSPYAPMSAFVPFDTSALVSSVTSSCHPTLAWLQCPKCGCPVVRPAIPTTSGLAHNDPS